MPNGHGRARMKVPLALPKEQTRALSACRKIHVFAEFLQPPVMADDKYLLTGAEWFTGTAGDAQKPRR